MVKNAPANAGDARDVGSVPGLGRSPGGGNGNPLQYSCLENTMDRRPWWATVHGCEELDTIEHVHTHTEAQCRALHTTSTQYMWNRGCLTVQASRDLDVETWTVDSPMAGQA